MGNVATTSGAAPGRGLQSGDISERSPLTVWTPTHPPAHTDYVHVAMSTSPRVHTNIQVCLYTTQHALYMCACVCMCVQMCAFVPMTHTHMAMPACTDAHAQMHRPGHRHNHSHSTGTEIRDPSSGLESGKATAPGRPQESPLSVPHSSQRKSSLSSNLELEPSFPAPPLGDTDFPALLPPPPGPAPG